MFQELEELDESLYWNIRRRHAHSYYTLVDLKSWYYQNYHFYLNYDKAG